MAWERLAAASVGSGQTAQASRSHAAPRKSRSAMERQRVRGVDASAVDLIASTDRHVDSLRWTHGMPAASHRAATSSTLQCKGSPVSTYTVACVSLRGRRGSSRLPSHSSAGTFSLCRQHEPGSDSPSESRRAARAPTPRPAEPPSHGDAFLHGVAEAIAGPRKSIAASRKPSIGPYARTTKPPSPLFCYSLRQAINAPQSRALPTSHAHRLPPFLSLSLALHSQTPPILGSQPASTRASAPSRPRDPGRRPHIGRSRRAELSGFGAAQL